VSLWDTGIAGTTEMREDARTMSLAGMSRKSYDIVSTRAAYALAGSLVAGTMLWIGAIVLIV
jgi:hypothetical protein